MVSRQPTILAPRPSRRQLLTGAAAIAAARFLAPASALAKAPAAGSDFQFSQFQLANGLDVILVPDHRLPVVTHTVWYKVGAGDEGAGQHGMAHFFEHLMFKGTNKYPRGTMDRIVDHYGGYINAATTMDSTSFIAQMPKEHLPKLMDMEADRMNGLLLTDDLLKTELGAVLEEKRGNESNDSTLFWQKIAAAMYPGHRLGISVIGLESELNAMNVAGLNSFYKRYYAPNNAILIVGGDLDEAELRRLAEATFGKVSPSRDLPARVRSEVPQKPSTRRVEFQSSQVSTVSINRIFRVPGALRISAIDNAALNALAELQNGFLYDQGAERHFTQNLKIASSAWGDYSRLMSNGEVRFGFEGLPGVTAADAEKALDTFMAGVRKSLPSLALFDDLKTSLVISDIKAIETSQAIVQWFGGFLTKGLTVKDVAGYRDVIRAVTITDLQRVIDTNLADDTALTGLMLPKA